MERGLMERVPELEEGKDHAPNPKRSEIQMGDLLQLDDYRKEEDGLVVLYNSTGHGGVVVPTSLVPHFLSLGFLEQHPELIVPECIVTPFEKREGEDNEN